MTVNCGRKWKMLYYEVISLYSVTADGQYRNSAIWIYFDSAVVSNVQNKYRRFREIVHCDIGKLTLRSKNVKRYIIFAT